MQKSAQPPANVKQGYCKGTRISKATAVVILPRISKPLCQIYFILVHNHSSSKSTSVLTGQVEMVGESLEESVGIRPGACTL